MAGWLAHDFMRETEGRGKDNVWLRGEITHTTMEPYRDRCLFQRKKGRAIISARREYLPRNTALKGSSVTVKIFICRNKKCADILEG
jgi:hypothetical protein